MKKFISVNVVGCTIVLDEETTRRGNDFPERGAETFSESDYVTVHLLPTKNNEGEALASYTLIIVDNLIPAWARSGYIVEALNNSKVLLDVAQGATEWTISAPRDVWTKGNACILQSSCPLVWREAEMVVPWKDGTVTFHVAENRSTPSSHYSTWIVNIYPTDDGTGFLGRATVGDGTPGRKSRNFSASTLEEAKKNAEEWLRYLLATTPTPQASDVRKVPDLSVVLEAKKYVELVIARFFNAIRKDAVAKKELELVLTNCGVAKEWLFCAASEALQRYRSDLDKDEDKLFPRLMQASLTEQSAYLLGGDCLRAEAVFNNAVQIAGMATALSFFARALEDAGKLPPKGGSLKDVGL